MSTTENKPIALAGGYRGLVSEGIISLRKNEKQRKTLTEELESAVQAAAKEQGVDLKDYVLDVETLDFVERPAPPEGQAAEPMPAVPEKASI